MDDIFLTIHNREFAENTLNRIRTILHDVYGADQGEKNYTYLAGASAAYVNSLSEDELATLRRFNPSLPYDHLKGKVFAISYPDNVYTDKEPTLKTLSQVLKKYFPGINGIHILPEREMSHGDVWAQDFHDFLTPEDARVLITVLAEGGVINDKKMIMDSYGRIRETLFQKTLTGMLEKNGIPVSKETLGNIADILDKAYNSHFNDGGFSQKTRAKIDRRFGTLEDLKELTRSHAVMLDYVVNHLDIDNEYLEEYRSGQNNGQAFIIVTPEEYEEMRTNGELAKTFRPRPFPLYTGARKYPDNRYSTPALKTAAMNKLFTGSGLKPLDERIILFFSIHFKIRNDQGLTAEDKRISASFHRYMEERGIDRQTVFTRSALQPSGEMFTPKAAAALTGFAELAGVDSRYAVLFENHDDEIFGEKFFIYTTFSESQVDINPVSEAGFKMIIDDLFHLLSSGNLAMMRMDAIKYLWKERGKVNFNMEEGNKLIEVVQKVMELVSPGVLPLDEVNSPDPVVYNMEKGGGFAYVFGQVNATVSAFNEGNLAPIENYYNLFTDRRPRGFVPFIMLSTHDGRSVQGLGVQRLDGHVSIEQFYNLKRTVENQGGRAKFRSVPAGQISVETFTKVLKESGLEEFREPLMSMFDAPASDKEGILRLKKEYSGRDTILPGISKLSGKDPAKLQSIPAVQYFLDWIIDGKTIYELCATSRSALEKTVAGRDVLTPQEEAHRFALAQAFVLTFGQAVPAIYFNDLLGLLNDEEGFRLSGKPRDLNRHKSNLAELESAMNTDPFMKEYLPMINRIVALRIQDGSYYPGSRNFEFVPLTDQVFLNHSFHKGKHSFVIGNISGKKISLHINIKGLKDTVALPGEITVEDVINRKKTVIRDTYAWKAELEPFGLLWAVMSKAAK